MIFKRYYLFAISARMQATLQNTRSFICIKMTCIVIHNVGLRETEIRVWILKSELNGKQLEIKCIAGYVSYYQAKQLY